MSGSIYGECNDIPNRVNGFGLAEVTPNAQGGVDITVDPPMFTGGNGMQITGAWPNYTFTSTGTGFGPAYAFNSGAGVLVSGGPTDYTFSLKVTGVTPGDYGPLTVNAYGQITQAGPMVSTIVGNGPITATYDAASGAVSLDLAQATATTPGIVELYNTVGSAPYPTDVALTPNGAKELFDAELASLGGLGANRTYVLISPATPAVDPAQFQYTTLLGTTATINVPAGESRAIFVAAKLTADLPGLVFVNATGDPAALAQGPQETAALHMAAGSVVGPFSGTLEVRFINPAAPGVSAGGTISSLILTVS
jgi:hypothetical protein